MTTLNINKVGQGNTSLVLLHGWGFNQDIWSSLIPLLSDHFTLYLVDLPGFGQSSLMTWALFKKQLQDQLPSSFAMLGWSLGGLFATRFAIEEPDCVSHLINVTSSPYFIKDEQWPGIEKQTLDQFFINLSCDPRRTIREFLALQLQHFPHPNNNLEPISSTLQALSNGLTILATWDLRPYLNTLKSPTCFMFGKLDAIVPRQLCSRLQALHPKFNYVLFNKAAHIPFITHQEEFISSLKSFLTIHHTGL